MLLTFTDVETRVAANRAFGRPQGKKVLSK